MITEFPLIVIALFFNKPPNQRHCSRVHAHTTNMANPCDICGDKGVIEAIITCCECKTSRQHLYCMRVVTTEAPQFWLCEECERKKLFSPTKTTDKEQIPEVLIQKNTRVLKSPNKSAFASRFNFKEKRVNTGRTKYISCDEAVKLSSGANKSEQQPPSSKNAFSSKHGSSRSMPPPREKSLVKIYSATNSKFESQLQQPVVQKSTAVKDSIKSTKCSSVRVERRNTESFSPRSEVLPPTKEEADIRKHIELPKSSNKIEKTITQETKSDVFPPTKEEADIELPKSSQKIEKTITQESTKMAKSEVFPPTKEVADIEVSKSSKKVEKTITQESTRMAKSDILPPTKEEEVEIEVPKSSQKVEETNMKTDTKMGGDKNHADVEDRELYLTMGGPGPGPVSEMHDTSIPALHSYWKGSFNLPNGHEIFNGAFRAHPPSNVHSKVYEALHKMPENICFELLPVPQVWVDLFQGDCPYKDDIGLYFFPRYKKRYEKCTLTDFLWNNNLVMKSYVDEVELFVLSSKFLQLNSQEFEGNYFLWGVFRANMVKDTSSKSIVVHENGNSGQRDNSQSKFYDIPPGFEKMQKPPPQG